MSEETADTRPGGIVFKEHEHPMLGLVREAMATGNLEMVNLFVTIYREERAEAARIAYHRAFARAKAEFTPVIKSRKASFGPGKASYSYEELDDVVDAVVPALSKYGLAHSWVTRNPPNGLISVTCVLAHENGYSEENELSAARDMSGSKNDIQAVISTVTYLQRATLKAKCGLAAGRDDDAHAAGKPAAVEPPISIDDVQKILARTVNLQIDMGMFYTVIAKQVGFPIEHISELKASHVKWVNDNLDAYERERRRQAAEAVKAQQKP